MDKLLLNFDLLQKSAICICYVLESVDYQLSIVDLLFIREIGTSQLKYWQKKISQSCPVKLPQLYTYLVVQNPD